MITIKTAIDGYINGWGGEVKVIKPDGKVTYQKATYWPDISKKYHLRGKSAGKGR
jgi:hypothetical protein